MVVPVLHEGLWADHTIVRGFPSDSFRDSNSKIDATSLYSGRDLGWNLPFLPIPTLYKDDAPDEEKSFFCQEHVSNCAALVEKSRPFSLLVHTHTHRAHSISSVMETKMALQNEFM